MGGWHPEILPMFCAFHTVDDVDRLISLLLAIREAVEVDHA